MACRFNCPGAFEIFPSQVSNSYLKHWIKRENILEGIWNTSVLHETWHHGLFLRRPIEDCPLFQATSWDQHWFKFPSQVFLQHLEAVPTMWLYPTVSLSSFTFIQEALLFFFTFRHKGSVICIYEVIDISPGNLDSSLCFIQPGIPIGYYDLIWFLLPYQLTTGNSQILSLEFPHLIFVWDFILAYELHHSSAKVWLSGIIELHVFFPFLPIQNFVKILLKCILSYFDVRFRM